MSTHITNNAPVFDCIHGDWPEGMRVLAETGVIREVPSKPMKVNRRSGDRYARIDRRSHACSTLTFSLFANGDMPSGVLGIHAGSLLTGVLRRRLATVLDATGADRGLWLAIEQRVIEGLRLFYSGKGNLGGDEDMRLLNHADVCRLPGVFGRYFDGDRWCGRRTSGCTRSGN